MKSILVTLMIVMSLWNTNGENPEAVPKDYSRFTLWNREYTVEDAGLPSGSQVKPIRGWYINGYQITPKEVKHKGAVVVFGGSEGSCDLMSALELAREGYEVYAMYFFGQENQRQQLDQVPLEFFAELYLHIQKTARSPEPLTIQGSSMGTELALLLAGYYSGYVDHLILYAPSAYVLEGTGRANHSGFMFCGKELPFIDFDVTKEVVPKRGMDARNRKPLRLVEVYRYGILYGENRDKARINLDPIRAKMLIFAGEMDDVRPAADMGREIKANYKGECELVTFEKAGHVFAPITDYQNIAMGGEPDANVEAKIVSDRIRLEKLTEWTK